VIVAALKDYLPLSDLWKIVVTCLLVAVVAPLAVSLAIIGDAKHRRAYVVLGVAIVLALIAAGLYTLFSA
jgi:hypothetical protein